MSSASGGPPKATRGPGGQRVAVVVAPEQGSESPEGALDGHPCGGCVRLEGDLWDARQSEVVALVRALEARERKTEPRQRVKALAEEDGAFTIRLSDLPFARTLGQTLAETFGAALEDHYPDGPGLPFWRRE
ncbi:MAG: hypothetical protein OXU20_03700 [Myxococcales bacterium]|nr:hypothetical protein [Myxococcales bacterium]